MACVWQLRLCVNLRSSLNVRRMGAQENLRVPVWAETDQRNSVTCKIITAAVTPTIATVIGHSHVQQYSPCFQVILSIVVTGSSIPFQFFEKTVSGGHDMLRWVGVSAGWCMRVKSALETHALEFVSWLWHFLAVQLLCWPSVFSF